MGAKKSRSLYMSASATQNDQGATDVLLFMLFVLFLSDKRVSFTLPRGYDFFLLFLSLAHYYNLLYSHESQFSEVQRLIFIGSVAVLLHFHLTTETPVLLEKIERFVVRTGG